MAITATNAKGEKIEWNGTEWVPVAAPAPTPEAAAPEAGSQGAAAPTPQPPDIRPGFNRAVRGFIDYTIPSMETVKTVFKRAIEPPLKFEMKDGKLDMSLAGGPAFWRDLTVGEGSRIAESAKTATERRAAGDTKGAAAAAAGSIPIVGGMARDLAETGLSGDYWGLGGKMAGIALPFGLSKARVSKVLDPAARSLERSATKSVIRAVDPAAKYTPEFLDNARNISRDIGVMHSREGMLERLAGQGALSREAQRAAKVTGHPADSLLGQSERNLRIVKEGVRDIPITPEQMEAAALRVEGAPPKLRYDPEARGGPSSMDPETIAAYKSEADRIRALSRGQETLEPGTGPGNYREVPQPGQTGYTSPTNAVYEEVPAQWNPEPTPVGEALKAKTQFGDAAKRGQGFPGQKSPLQAPTPSGKAAGVAHGVMGDTAESAIRALDPKLADVFEAANLSYAQRRQLADLLTVAAEREAKAAPSALATMALRTGVKGALSASLGGAATAAAGGAPLAGAMAGGSMYGLFKVAQEVLRSPQFNSLSAQQKFLLADMLRAAPNTAPLARAAGHAQTMGTLPPSDQE